jgi:bifunctional ADP-heptose synthase (sugar kinase/adenylyltransferase)
VRIDRATRASLSEAVLDAVASRFLRAAARADALLVSDYGTGLVTPEIVARAQRG